jgi:Ca2+-binding EF-hand superfamily protein
VDENCNVLKGPQTGIFIENKKFLVGEENSTGGVLVPFESNASKTDKNLMVFHENFARMVKVKFPTENYRLAGDFIFNTENVRAGENCTVIFTAKLFLNDKLTFLEKILNAKIEVVIKNENGISISKYFNSLNLNYKQDYAFEFLVPPKTIELEFKFSGTVDQQAGGQATLGASKTTKIDKFSAQKDSRFFSVYLTHADGRYVLKCLGKNGDPLKCQNLTIQLFQNF